MSQCTSTGAVTKVTKRTQLSDGTLVRERHHLGGPQDQTYSYRTVGA